MDRLPMVEVVTNGYQSTPFRVKTETTYDDAGVSEKYTVHFDREWPLSMHGNYLGSLTREQFVALRAFLNTIP